MARGPRTGHRYRQLRDQVITTGTVCVICGAPVNKALPGRHPWGPSLHHAGLALRWGGPLLDPDNAGLAHTGCNAAVRDAPPGSLRYVRAVARRREAYARGLRGVARRRPGTPSREW